MRLLQHPKVPIFEVQTTLAQCRTVEMIEMVVNMALEDERYSSEELAQMEETASIQKAALRC